MIKSSVKNLNINEIEALSIEEAKTIALEKLNIKDEKIYKEHEFILTENEEEYHGIIDLMNIYDDHIDIIDYKLKNILDTAYLKQLNGYKNYIEGISNKKVYIYLYSIMDEKIEDLN